MVDSDTLLRAACEVDPLVVWGAFVRLLGVVQLISLLSIRSQLLALAGPRGATPATLLLARVRADFHGWAARWQRLPTLLWLTGADEAGLMATMSLGILCAVALLLGWIIPSPVATFVVYACLLSLDEIVDLKFPWDSLLLELSALAALLPPLEAPVWQSIRVTTAPHPWVAFVFRFALFRLLFGFGKLKFVGSTSKDICYIRTFVVGLPLPTPVGVWLYGALPHAAWGIALAAMFLIEIVAPFFLFCTGSPRVGAAASIALLQVGIQLTGNFGHFNLLTTVLCVPMLDAHASVFDVSLSQALGLAPGQASGGKAGVAALLVPMLVATHTLGALLALPFNSWCTNAYLSWPMIAIPPFAPVNFFEFLGARLRLIHAWGIFPPNAGPPCRFIQVLEGSADGQTWEEYEWRHMTTNERSAPRFVAPHHPRLDFMLFYTSLGLDAEHLLGTASRGSPYVLPLHPLLARVMQRLLEGGSPVQTLFGHNPFPDHGKRGPPRYMRATLYAFMPRTSPDAGGGADVGSGRDCWWHRRRVGVHIAARDISLRACMWQQHPPPPELAHLESLPSLLRQSSALRSTARCIVDTGPIEGIANAGLRIAMKEFWGIASFIGCNDAGCYGKWGAFRHSGNGNDNITDCHTITRRARALRATFSAFQLYEAERVWGRLTAALMQKWEPHFKQLKPEQLCEPRLDAVLKSFLMLGALAHDIIRQGETAVTTALKSGVTEALVQRARNLTPQVALYSIALFRHDLLLLHARKARLQAAVQPSHAAPLPSGPPLPGMIALLPFMRKQLVDGIDVDTSLPPCAHSAAERLPVCTSPSAFGQWRVAFASVNPEPDEQEVKEEELTFGIDHFTCDQKFDRK